MSFELQQLEAAIEAYEAAIAPYVEGKELLRRAMQEGFMGHAQEALGSIVLAKRLLAAGYFDERPGEARVLTHTMLGTAEALTLGRRAGGEDLRAISPGAPA